MPRFEPADRAVGDDGLATISALATPIQWTVNSEITLDQFWFLYADHPKEMGEYFAAVQTLYCGDHVVDIQAARAAGVRVIAIEGGPCSREEKVEASPTVLVPDLRKVLESL